jgi:hypothetical protein
MKSFWIASVRAAQREASAPRYSLVVQSNKRVLRGFKRSADSSGAQPNAIERRRIERSSFQFFEAREARERSRRISSGAGDVRARQSVPGCQETRNGPTRGLFPLRRFVVRIRHA